MCRTVKSQHIVGGRHSGRLTMSSRLTPVVPVVILAVACFASLAISRSQAKNITERSIKAVQQLPTLRVSSTRNSSLGRRYLNGAFDSSMGEVWYGDQSYSMKNSNHRQILNQGNKKTHALSNVHASWKLAGQQKSYTINHLLAKLYAGIIFRDNIINVLGFILSRPGHGLNFQQYISLRHIHDALRYRQVYMFEMLPVLNKLQEKSKMAQLQLIMHELSRNVPRYLQSACKFWVEEIGQRNVDVESMLLSSHIRLDFLKELNPAVVKICRIAAAAENMIPYDKVSRLTANHLGLVFVKIFDHLQRGILKLSQKLFGIILANLPTIEFNPAFEEQTRFILDMTQRNQIPNWESIVENGIDFKDPYSLVHSVISRALSSNSTLRPVRDALRLIEMEIMLVPSFPTNSQCNVMPELGDVVDWNVLLKPIKSPEFPPEVVHMKNDLLTSVGNGTDSTVIEIDYPPYVYQDSIDLLISSLMRLQRQLSDSEKDIKRTIASLISALTLKKNSCSNPLPNSAQVNFLTVVQYFQNPNVSPHASSVADQLLDQIDRRQDVLDTLNDIIPKDKTDCASPRQCMNNILKKVEKEKHKIPSDIYTNLETMKLLFEEFENRTIVCPVECGTITAQPPLSTTESPDFGTTTVQPNSSPPTDSPKYDTTNDQTTPEPWLLETTTPVPSTEELTDVTLTVTSTEVTSTEVTPTEVTPTEVTSTEVTSTESPLPTKPPTAEPPKNGPKPNISLPLEVTTVSPAPETESPIEDQPIMPLTVPPNIPLTKDLKLIFVERVPFITDTNFTVTFRTDHADTLPSAETLVKPPDPKDSLTPLARPLGKDMFEPLQKLFGQNLIHAILGPSFNMTQCQTNACLLIRILQRAAQNPKVSANKKLLEIVENKLLAIDYISTMLLIHLVTSYNEIGGPVIYVTFNPNEPDHVFIGDQPPEVSLPGYVTIGVIHSLYMAMAIDSDKPYDDLLPILPSESPVENQQKLLTQLLLSDNIEKILGPKFNPSAFPNRGALLIGVLRQLLDSPEIKKDRKLFDIINTYLIGIRLGATSTSIPVEYLDAITRHIQSNWKVHLPILMQALPPATNNVELAMMQTVLTLLSQNDLLEILEIPSPTSSTTHGQLLKTIIDAAIVKLNTDQNIITALKYYQKKVMMDGFGGMPILFVYEITIRISVDLGEVIANVIDFDELPPEGKSAYNSLVKYLVDNSSIYENSEAFSLEVYKTEGTMLRAFFQHLLQRNDIDASAKKNIRYLLPYVQLEGPGLKLMPQPTVEHQASLLSRTTKTRYNVYRQK